jgi:UDP-arabinose 4-epimerase
MQERSILVAGGAGYIGSHTCKALRRSGFVPVVFDNLTTGHREFVKWGLFVQGDIRDKSALAEVIRTHKIDAVLHFAACAYVGESVIEPEKYYDNNVAGTLSLLAAMRMAGCSKIVFSSTCAVYGQHDGAPIAETARLSPVNPYGASKLMAETMLSDFSAAYGLRYTALRYFNAAGADPDGELGELRDPETHLIPRAIMALQGHIHDFAVYGNDYDTPDGTAIRDYIHVADLAEAHVAALRRLLAEGGNGAFNLGTGAGYSVREVLNAITAKAGSELPLVKGARRPGDPAVLVADASLARQELGFTPAQSDLDTIIATAWKWHAKAHPRRDAAKMT